MDYCCDLHDMVLSVINYWPLVGRRDEPSEPSIVRFFTVSSNETTRGHICKLFVCHSRVDVRKYFLCNRVVKIWNSLPATSEDFASIRIFNSLIKRKDLSRFVNF